MAGNEIRIYQRESKAISTLATPASGFLADPIFTPDGKRVVYSLGDAINGAWGGNVGLGRVLADGSENQILYPAAKEFGLFHLIDPKQFIGDRLFAIRAKPLNGGTFIAYSYAYELLEVGPPIKSVYSWSNGENSERPSSFGADENGQLIVYDKGWRKVGAKENGGIIQAGNKTIGVYSPDGRRLGTVTPVGVEIIDIQTNKGLAAYKVHGQIQTIIWSPDSRRLAVLSTQYKQGSDEVFSYDELSVYQP